MQWFDQVTLDGVRRTKDGFLAAHARVARTGIQIYGGNEVGRPDMHSVRVYRPEAEVFSKDAMASFAHRPVTLDHPPEMVTADNWRTYAVGQTGDEVARDKECIRVPMLAMDANAIGAIDAGKRELSMGYTCDLKWEPGKTDDGEEYDAVQRNIRANHLAIVHAARGGSKLRVGDQRDPDALNDLFTPLQSERTTTMADQPALKTVLVDGISISITDQGAQALEKVTKQLADALTAKAVAETKIVADATISKTAIEAKDAEIATLKKQLADAAITPAKLRDAAKSYGLTIAQAKVLAPTLKIEDAMDTAAIQKAVVLAKMGDAAKDWSDIQFATSFSSFAAGIPADKLKTGGATDALRDTLRGGLQSTVPADGRALGDAALAKSVDDLNAWRTAKTA